MEQIKDKGIILNTRIHGNTSQIVTIFSQNFGIISGYIKGGLKKTPAMLGNLVEFSWQARVLTHLGKLEANVVENFSTVFANDILKMAIINSVCEMIAGTIKENDPHEKLFEKIIEIFKKLKQENNKNALAKLYIQFEMTLFDELGFGFNLNVCNVSGIGMPEFISPKTGSAVSKEVASGYENQLFKIPAFFLQNTEPSLPEIHNAMEINLHFFVLHFGKKIYSTRNFLQSLFVKMCV